MTTKTKLQATRSDWTAQMRAIEAALEARDTAKAVTCLMRLQPLICLSKARAAIYNEYAALVQRLIFSPYLGDDAQERGSAIGSDPDYLGGLTRVG